MAPVNNKSFLGVDVGGTFTDFVLFKDGNLKLHKRLTSRPDPTVSILAGLHEMKFDSAGEIVHGSTIATNALLERKGAQTALITTRGFADVIEIGRQNRPDLYALYPRKSLPLIPSDLRVEIEERVDADGQVLIPLTDTEIARIVKLITQLSVESVAVCLLFSFLNPNHETRLKSALESICNTSISSEILPEYREYERTSTTVLNAYVSPVMGRYLHSLQQSLGKRRLQIMQSNGGVVSPETASREAARTLLSGPAGGAIGAYTVAKNAGYTQIIGFDMGGTSTDVSLFPGEIVYTREHSIDGFPLRLPVIDIHTIGAGGGSVAWVDAGGALHVGPQSAGADPGPACYGKQTDTITTTDANLLLGRLHSEHFLGGQMKLSLDHASRAMNTLRALFPDIASEQLAYGIVQIANSAMQRAIRMVSVERGYDPRDFTLVPFGGAGPLHACALASEMRIPRILIPVMPGVLSALGMLLADLTRDYLQTIMLTGEMLNTNTLDTIFALLSARAVADLQAEAFLPDQISIEQSLDMRYRGQSFEVPVKSPSDGDWIAAFHDAHNRRYGYQRIGETVEAVNARIKAVGLREKPEIPLIKEGGTASDHAIVGETQTWLGDGFVSVPMIDREKLLANNVIDSPALVFQIDATTLVEEGWQASVDQWGNLILTQ